METADNRLITLKQAESLTRKTGGFDAFWDNYDLIIWRRERSGYARRDGLFRNGSWGVATRYPIGDNGKYVVPLRYARVVGGGPRDTISN